MYAAYGEFLFAWNATGGPNKGVSITEMPYEKVLMCSTTSTNGLPDEPCYYDQPKPTIVALLLHDKRLTAIVSEHNIKPVTSSSSSSMEDWPIIYDFANLSIRVYDISSIPSDGSPLNLLAKSNHSIKGQYKTAVSSINTVTIVAYSDISMYSFREKLYRSNFQYCGLNSTEYMRLAVETALNQTEPFLEVMLEELQLQVNGSCDSIVPVSAHT